MAKKKQTLTTPVGIAEYPKLTKPDTKFDEAGVFSTKVRLSGEDAATLRSTIDAAMTQSLVDAKAEAAREGKKAKVKQADPPYTENEDGTISFSFKRKASGVTKAGEAWTARVALFDKAGKPLPQTTNVGGGTQLAVAYEIQPFYTKLVGAGVSLRLAAAQIHELVEFGGDAKYFGFATVEEAVDAAEDEDENVTDATDTGSVDF